MAFQLPALPYATDALEPNIDKLTMEIHHGKHHNAYVTNLNAAIAGTDADTAAAAGSAPAARCRRRRCRWRGARRPPPAAASRRGP